MTKSTPKIGLALSGASSRSVFYIGFLEVLKEQGFSVDYIAAMSGSAVVAAAFACDTMDELKKDAFRMNTDFLFEFIERSKGKRGIYHMNKVEALVREYTNGQSFEAVSPKLGLVATDIDSGEEVVLQVGDIAKSVCASCTLPGIFEPIQWGNKHLVDGGLVNIVPGNVARSAGCDVVIGIDMRATRHVFSPWQIALKKLANNLKAVLWPNQAKELWHRLATVLDNTFLTDQYPNLTPGTNGNRYPHLFSVLGRSLDIAIQAQANQSDPTFQCDLLIVPETPKLPSWKKYLFLHFTDFTKTQDLYRAGRATALEYLPKMRKLIDSSAGVET